MVTGQTPNTLEWQNIPVQFIRILYVTDVSRMNVPDTKHQHPLP